jgi:hypothetical protein
MLWTKDEVQSGLMIFFRMPDLKFTINESDGKNPFHRKHISCLNQAIGVNGGDPSGTPFLSGI